MLNLPRRLLPALGVVLLTLGVLPGCSAGARTKMDDFWRMVDPLGHTRSHRERYYPYERKTGKRLGTG